VYGLVIDWELHDKLPYLSGPHEWGVWGRSNSPFTAHYVDIVSASPSLATGNPKPVSGCAEEAPIGDIIVSDLTGGPSYKSAN
jgi:hypothetical protein